MHSAEAKLESDFLDKLAGLKYTLRPEIRDRAALEANFRHHFQTLNRVNLTDAEFARLLDEITTPDVYTASKTLRETTAFTRDDGSPQEATAYNLSLMSLKCRFKNAAPDSSIART